MRLGLGRAIVALAIKLAIVVLEATSALSHLLLQLLLYGALLAVDVVQLEVGLVITVHS